MILLMTDADFHYSLDGKLAGIIADNDLQCRQRGEGRDQMYPSYSQVKRTILEVCYRINQWDYRVVVLVRVSVLTILKVLVCVHFSSNCSGLVPVNRNL